LPSCLLFLIACCLDSCKSSDLYEKNVSVPHHEWASSYKPGFSFTIKDTQSVYRVYFVIRHTEKYNYKNIWINFFYQSPGDSLRKELKELTLATDDKGWLGTAIDDIYEQRIELTRDTRLKAGEYKFMLENMMREDPLKHILNVGIRVEKK